MRLVNNVIQTQNLQQRVTLEIDNGLIELEDIVDTFKYHRTDPRLISEVKKLMIRANSPKNFSHTYKQKKINYLFDDLNRFTDVLTLAAKVHESETRESGMPYIFHAFGVGLFLSRLGFPIYTIYTGILHDVLESENCTNEDIQKIKKMGQDILLYIQAVTPKKIYDPDKKDEDMYRRIELSSMPNISPKATKIGDGYLNNYDIDSMTANEFYTREERIKRYKDKIEKHCLGYAIEIDNLGLIRIKEDKEIFSLSELIKEKINN